MTNSISDRFKPLNLTKQKVLFLCTGNSARSQMAQALLHHKAGDRYDVFSAGTLPEPVDEKAIEALKKFGVSADDLTSKNIATYEGEAFDYVITLCDKANKECRNYPNAKKQLAWDFPDPKSRTGNAPFSVTLSELNNRLSMFLLVEEKTLKAPAHISPHSTQDNSLTSTTTENTDLHCCEQDDKQGNEQDNVKSTKQSDVQNEEKSNEITIEPVSFFKCLTDNIRLKTLMLTHYHGELCVCELMAALDEESQPKVSRNLAVLKKSHIITDRKHGQWVFYRINPNLPLWAKAVIATSTENNVTEISEELQRLDDMNNRPNKTGFC